MNEPKSRIETADALNDVISKLYAVDNFIQFMGDPSFVLSKRAPTGLSLIITECVNALKTIGGFYERPDN